MVEKQKYWLEDIVGKHYIFEAADEKEALHHFMMEGDHAWQFGIADKAYFVSRLKGKKNA